MDWIPPELIRIKTEIEKGERPTCTVRDLLKWFQAQRRGVHVVSAIRRVLKNMELSTLPDFEFEWMDGIVTFAPYMDQQVRQTSAAAAPTVSQSPTSTAATDTTSAVATVRSLPAQDPAYSIRRLQAANQPPTSVPPDASVEKAITIMLDRDFSQLPVITNNKVQGVFSWKSLGSRLALNRPCLKVSDAVDPVRTVTSEASIFQAADLLAEEDVLLVQVSRTDLRIAGILTTTDLTSQFGRLGEPFLLIGEIENSIRSLIDTRFHADDMKMARLPNDTTRTVETAADLTFGEYIRLLQLPENWSKCQLAIDRVEFIKSLDQVRSIRNDVMHFDPDGIDPDALKQLRQCSRFLNQLARLGAI